eukprot:2685797-Lingulodinium_polyedra.AAC.1
MAPAGNTGPVVARRRPGLGQRRRRRRTGPRRIQPWQRQHDVAGLGLAVGPGTAAVVGLAPVALTADVGVAPVARWLGLACWPWPIPPLRRCGCGRGAAACNRARSSPPGCRNSPRRVLLAATASALLLLLVVAIAAAVLLAVAMAALAP